MTEPTSGSFSASFIGVSGRVARPTSSRGNTSPELSRAAGRALGAGVGVGVGVGVAVGVAAGAGDTTGAITVSARIVVPSLGQKRVAASRLAPQVGHKGTRAVYQPCGCEAPCVLSAGQHL